MLSNQSIRESKIWSYVDTNGPMHPVLKTRCWIWTRGKTAAGYGRIGKDEYTHRTIWKLIHGKFRKAFMFLHKCDNPPCIRPKHLFVGTRSDNIQDAIAKGRLRNQHTRKSHCMRGHRFNKKNTRFSKGRNNHVWRVCRTCRRITRIGKDY